MNKLVPCFLLATFATAAGAQVEPKQNPVQPPRSTPSQSQPVPGPSEGVGAITFESLDKNADQKISKAEAAMDRNVNQSFSTLDANSDGSLTMAEFATHKPRN